MLLDWYYQLKSKIFEENLKSNSQKERVSQPMCQAHQAVPFSSYSVDADRVQPQRRSIPAQRKTKVYRKHVILLGKKQVLSTMPIFRETFDCRKEISLEGF